MTFQSRLLGAVAAIILASQANAPAQPGPMAAGWRHSVALGEDGVLWTWGDNAYGQLGNGSYEASFVPIRVRDLDGTPLDGFSAVWAGTHHTVALHRDGSLWAWGNNTFGQLGNGRCGLDDHSPVPVRVLGPDGQGYLDGIVAVAAGWDHTVALREDGTVWAWGSSCHGQLGDGVRDSNRCSVHPIAVLGPKGEGALNGVQAITCGAHHTLALREDGTVWAWGSNWDGQLGSGRSGAGMHSSAPVQVTGPNGQERLPKVTAIAAGMHHSLAACKDGSVWAWGQNRYGQLGNGIRDNSSAPQRVRGGQTNREHLSGVVQLAAGFEASYALCKEGAVWAWGWNAYGDLGAGVSSLTRRTPVPVRTGTADEEAPPLQDIEAIAAGMHHVLAKDRNGELWAWGHGGFGQLGNGTNRRDGTFAAARAVPGDQVEKAWRPAPAFRAVGEALGEGTVFDVRRYDAAGNGVALDTPAIQAAIDAAHKAGGGIVLLQAGTYRSGTLQLQSNVTLHLEPEATLLGSTNREHFSERALIIAENAEKIGITGAGVIDGQGQGSPAQGWRHHLIRFTGCSGVTVAGVTLRNPGSWTQHYIECSDVTVRGIMVSSPRPRRNNDGLNFSGCRDVLVTGNTIVSEDDAIVVKSQRAERVNRNMTFLDNRSFTICGVFKMGTETRSTFSDITVRGLRGWGGKAIELYSVDGSHVENIEISDVRVKEALSAVTLRLGARLRSGYWAADETPEPGRLRHIRIRDVEVELAHRSLRDVLLDHGFEDAGDAASLLWSPAPQPQCSSFIAGLPEHPIQDVVLEHVRVSVPGGAAEEEIPAEVPERATGYPSARILGVLPAWGVFVRHAEDIVLRNLKFELRAPDARPPIVQDHVEGLSVEGLKIRQAWTKAGGPN